VASERAYRNYSTAIGEVLDRAVDLPLEAPSPCDRRVIDVSGDGVSNEGMRPGDVHARLAREGITVNGLAIRGAQAEIVPCYRERVLFGPGAFPEIADGYDDFPRDPPQTRPAPLRHDPEGTDAPRARSPLRHQRRRRDMAISVGDTVKWNWADGTGEGTVKQIYKEKITKTIKGSDITRKASDDEPAYLIEQEDGDKVLKSVTEIEAT